jgi:hypothetical protein
VTLTRRHHEAIALARMTPALRRVGKNGKTFVSSPCASGRGAIVYAKAVDDLVDAGLMRWVNKCRSAAVLTEEGRHQS